MDASSIFFWGFLCNKISIIPARQRVLCHRVIAWAWRLRAEDGDVFGMFFWDILLYSNISARNFCIVTFRMFLDFWTKFQEGFVHSPKNCWKKYGKIWNEDEWTVLDPVFLSSADSALERNTVASETQYQKIEPWNQENPEILEENHADYPLVIC